MPAGGPPPAAPDATALPLPCTALARAAEVNPGVLHALFGATGFPWLQAWAARCGRVLCRGRSLHAASASLQLALTYQPPTLHCTAHNHWARLGPVRLQALAAPLLPAG
jgi:hypothetical protein